MCQQVEKPTAPHKQPSFLFVKQTVCSPNKPAATAILMHKQEARVATLL